MPIGTTAEDDGSISAADHRMIDHQDEIIPQSNPPAARDRACHRQSSHKRMMMESHSGMEVISRSREGVGLAYLVSCRMIRAAFCSTTCRKIGCFSSVANAASSESRSRRPRLRSPQRSRLWRRVCKASLKAGATKPSRAEQLFRRRLTKS